MAITEQTIEELIKSHKYSRKEFKNGTWYYYYDKHNNFGRIAQCKSSALTFQINRNLSEKRPMQAGRKTGYRLHQ